MSTATCAREYLNCTEPAGGYNGKFIKLCWKCARTRLAHLELIRRDRHRRLLGFPR